jgi:iron complex transport system permease protein
MALACAAASLCLGPAAISLHRIPLLLVSGGETPEALIIREIRLPRTLLALGVGASLGMCGAALQGYLRNPLADPGVIGVSSSAALGAVIALYSGFSALFPLALPLAGIAGALACVICLFLIARNGGALGLILAGVAISAFASALTALALNLSPNPYAALEIVFWMMGSLADRSLEHVALAFPFMLAGCLILATTGRWLDALTLGEEAAHGLGVDGGKVSRRIVLGAGLAVGASVAVAGAVGFIGLIAPHLLRPLTGAQPSRVLAASALGGAVLLCLADCLVRLSGPETEIGLGVATALLGAPLFVVLSVGARSARSGPQ